MPVVSSPKVQHPVRVRVVTSVARAVVGGAHGVRVHRDVVAGVFRAVAVVTAVVVLRHRGIRRGEIPEQLTQQLQHLRNNPEYSLFTERHQ